MNFPMQAAGSEMMRMATILLAKAGIRCCGVIHDAFLVEADEKEIEGTVKRNTGWRRRVKSSFTVTPSGPMPRRSDTLRDFPKNEDSKFGKSKIT